MVKKRYSYLITPLLLLIDLLIINAVIIYISDRQFMNGYFISYINIFWIIISIISNYYKVYRFTKTFRIFSLLFIQQFLFVLAYFSYFGIFKEGTVVHNQFVTLVSILIGISVFKLMAFFALKLYRRRGMNFRNVVILGHDDTAIEVAYILTNKTDLGYKYHGFFSDKPKKQTDYLGKLKESYNYIMLHDIDEIYCTISALKKEELKEFTKFANTHSRIIKLIPNSNELYSKNTRPVYYDNTLLLNVKRLPLDMTENRVVKRIFDIFFSIFVIIFLLSWMLPLLSLLIVIGSKGPALFKQQREGLGGHHFTCYKFRSMKINKSSDKIHATINDERITVIGSLLRKTSIDELPQFFNVLKGDMSVVGPRPHMTSLSSEYQKEIDNYIERHSVKPGITGLAQVSGYRGEVKQASDIKNRVRFDIFYIENWSILLDVKIIINTIFNVLRGEEKAY